MRFRMVMEMMVFICGGYAGFAKVQAVGKFRYHSCDRRNDFVYSEVP